MNISKDTIIELLAGVRDPMTAQSIVDMGYVKEVHFEGQFVNISLEIGKLDATQKSDLNFACMLAIQDSFPELSVNVHLISSQQEGSAQNAVLPQVANVIAIASGKGGVGKSTIAVNLALGLKKLGARVGIMDADLYGPSIPTMLHLQNKRPKVQEVYGKPKMIPLEAYGMPVISIGNIVEPEQAVVLRGPRLAGIIKQFVQETIWPPLDYLILDLPPGTGDIQLTLVQTLPITGVILVTTPQEVAMADAIKAMNMFLLPQINVPILGVVENMSWFTPDEIPDSKYFIFGSGGGEKLAKMSLSELLGKVPLRMSIREGGDSGQPSVMDDDGPDTATFVEIARRTMELVTTRNQNQAPTQIVQVNT